MPRTTTRQHPSRTSLGSLLLGATLTLHGGLLMAQPEDAGQAQSERPLNTWAIAPGPLGATLSRFANAAGIVISFDASLTNGRQSPGLNGRYSIEEGFARLLSGTDLQVLRAGEDYLLIRRDEHSKALELGATSVNANRLGEVTEGSGSYTTGQVAVGSKIAQSPREVPHSVSVITRQQIEDQNLTSLNEVMERTTGVISRKATQNAGSSFGNDNNFYSRGFQVSNIQLDGGAPQDPVLNGFGSVSQLDMAQFDHVEFLRGVDGLYSGAGDPGGTINMVRKRALGHDQITFSASAGRWNNYRSEADVTGPLNAPGTARGRLGVAWQDRDYFYDPANMRTRLAYGSLEFDLTSDTLLTVGGSYQEADGVTNFGGLPRYSSGADLKLPRSTSLTTDWNTSHETTRQGYVRLDHHFDEDWALTLDAMRMDMDRDAQGVFAYGAVSPVTGEGNFITGFPATTGMERSAYSVTLKGGFQLFERHHDLVLVADHQQGKATSSQHMLTEEVFPIDVFNPVMPPDNGNISVKDSYFTARKTGYAGMLRLSLADPLKLSLGARIADYTHNDNEQYLTATGEPDGSQGKRVLRDNNVVTPYGGITYELNENWTLYASYAETYRPQYMQLKGPRPGTPLQASEAKSYELGVKGELFDGRLNTAVALYRVEQQGDAARVSDDGITNGQQCCFINLGDTVSQGVDAEISGELAAGWQMIAGYTFNHSRDDNSLSASNRAFTPKHLIKVWTTYQLRDQLERWKVGGGVVAQSATYVSGTVRDYNPASGDFDGEALDYKFIEPGRAVWAASLDYRIDEHWSATVNANNLFDKRYYDTFGTSASGNFYGEPRNLVVTVRSKF